MRPDAAQRIPDALGRLRRVAHVNLISLLTAEPGLADDHRATVDLRLHQPVIGNLPQAFAQQVGHQLFRQRALHLQRGHVQLADIDIPAFRRVHPLQPQHKVGVRDREPEFILRQPQQNRIVQDAALVIAQYAVFATHRLDAGGVAGDDCVDEILGIRPFDADLPLHRDVPQRHAIDQRPVFRHRPAILGPGIAARVIHAVVDGGTPRPRLDRQVPERRFAHPC